MSLYDGIEKVSAPRLPFLSNGDYTLKFVIASTGQNFTDKKEYFRTEVEVLESSGPEALVPGTSACIKIDEDPKWGYHKRDIRNLVAAVMDEPETAVTGAIVDQLLAEDNPASGETFYARRGYFQNPKTGGAFVKTVFASDRSKLPPTVAPPDAANDEEVETPKKVGRRTK